MDAYIDDGDIYCEDCRPDDASGPYADGGGEADCPQHCGACGVFLENPLTTDGYRYVRERAETNPTSPCVQEWADYYDIQVHNDDDE